MVAATLPELSEWTLHSLRMGLFCLSIGQFSNSVAAHTRTNEVEVTPGCKAIKTISEIAIYKGGDKDVARNLVIELCNDIL